MKLKFNEDNTIEELQHASPAKPGKHFQSFFVDCFLLILVSYFLFLLGNNIAINTNTYKEAEVIVKEEVDYYKSYVEESRAVEFEIINGEKVRKDAIADQTTGVSKIVLENINRAIYYSVEKYGNFDTQFGMSIKEEHMELIKLSISDKGHAYDDNVSYFYSEYAFNNDVELGLNFYTKNEAHEYVHKVYKDTFGSQASKFFVFDLEQSLVPILKTEAAYYLYYFVYIAEDPDIKDVAEDYYFLFDTSYSNMLSSAETLMVKAEPYYSTHYSLYYENKAILGRCVNIALIISVVLGYIITIIIPKFIMKHGRTIGRFLFKLGEIDVYNKPITWKVVLVKGILGCIGYLPVIFLIYMLEPFNGSFEAMYVPFIGEMQLMVILFIILLLVLINGTVMLFTRNKVGIDGLITKSILVDRHYLDELLFEEE